MTLRRETLRIISFFLLLSLTAGIVNSQGALAEPSGTPPVGSVRDWMYEQTWVRPNTACPWFSTEDYITARLAAWRSVQLGPEQVGGRPGEEVRVEIWRCNLVAGKAVNRTHIRNVTFADDHTHKVQIERIGPGTYQYDFVYHYLADDKVRSDSMKTEVRHPPVPYSIKVQDPDLKGAGGRAIKFVPRGEGNWTVTVRTSRNTQGETDKVYTLNDSHTFRIEDSSAVLVRVTVSDQYGWVNSEDGGRDKVVVYQEPDLWPFLRLALLALMVALVALLIYVRKRNVGRLVEEVGSE